MEGPDLCGKTTLFGRLRTCVLATFVPGLPLDPVLVPHMAHVEARQEALWAALYDPSKLYVCDRHFSVTNRVYAQLYGRPCADYSRWYPELRVLYLYSPLSMLLNRHAERGDKIAQPEHFGRVLELYDAVLARLPHVVRLDAQLSLHELAVECMQRIGVWRQIL